MVSRDEAETLLKTDEAMSTPGTFLLRFANSRMWPHPDAGALVVSYVGNDRRIHHKLLTLDVESGARYVLHLKLHQPFVLQLSDVLINSCTRNQEFSQYFGQQNLGNLLGCILTSAM